MARRSPKGTGANYLEMHTNDRDRALFEELEPRLLYSAGTEAVLLDTIWAPVGAPVLQALSGFVDPAVRLTTAPASDVRHEVVFVDANTPDFQQLVDDLLTTQRDGVRIDVIIIDQAGDGIEQIDSALLAYDDLDAVHFISHGSSDGVQLGGTWLSNDSLDRYRSTIAGWRDVLSEDADLLFYGCELAAGADGRALIAALGDLTGADIAASSDWTGSAALGGDWELEHANGDIEAGIVISAQAQSSWQGVLNSAPVLDGSPMNLWLSSINDVTGSSAPGLANWTDGEVLHFGAPDFGLGPGTTDGTFSAGVLDLDSLGDGDTDIDALHYVTRNVTVGSGVDSFDLLAGDVLLSTQGDENLSSTNSLSVKSKDVFVFRPDTPGDYSSGTFYLLLDEALGAEIKGLTLVEQDTLVGGTLLEAGTFLLSEGDKNIYHFTADAVGELTTSGTITTLVEGPDIGIDQNIVGLELIENTVTVGGITLNTGEILVTLDNEDPAVGSGPIATERRDILTLTITQTGPTTLGDASMLFDGSDVGLASNDENIDALALVPTPRLDPILEDLAPASNNGTLVSALITDLFADVDGDPSGLAVIGVDDSNGTWEYSLDGGSTWLAFGAVTDSAAIVLGATDRVRFDPNADYDGNAEFTFRAWDGTDGSTAGDMVDASVNGGATAFSTETADARIEVAAVNDTPQNTIPVAQATNEDTTLVFSAGNGNLIAIADVDAATGELRITLTAANGILTLNGTTGLTFTTGTGSGDPTMTFYGTLTDINAALDGMSFTPTADYSGAASVTIMTEDLGHVGTGGAGSDSDVVNVTVNAINDAPVLDGSPMNLWLSSIADVTGSSAPGLASWSEGELLRFGAPDFSLGAGTTNGTFSSVFNLDSFGDGDTDIDALHYVTRNVTVGSGVDSFDLLAGDVLLSTQGDENLNSTNSLSVKSEDVFVFRPDVPGDYSSGTFYLLLDDALGAQTEGLTLVEQDTLVGGTLLEAGTFLLSEGNKNIYHFTADTVGELTTSGTVTLLVEGPDIGIDQNIIGLALIESPVTMGGVTLHAGQILVTLENDDSAVGSGPIATERRDILVLTITQTGPTTLGDASMLFDGSDVGLSDNDENLDALALVPTPRLDPILEDLPASLNEGTLVSDLLGPLFSDVDGDPPGMAVTGVDDTNGTWEYSLDGGTTWLAFGAVTDSAAIVLGATDRVRFDPDLDYDGNAEFTFRAWDASNGSAAGDTADASIDGGATAFSTDTATARIEVNAQNETNDAPINIVPGPQATTEGTAVVFSTANGNRVYIADFDALGGSMLVTLSTDYGVLTLNGVAGLTFTTGDGTDDATMTFTGTVSDINAALEGLTFTPAHDYVGVATLRISTDDQGNSGAGGPLSDSDSFFVFIEGNAVNDAPVSDVPGTQYSGVDMPIVFMDTNGNAIWAIDDAGNHLVQLTLTATNGLFSLNLPTPSEEQVNTYTTSEQLAPGVAVAPSGAYVVVWQSKDQDGNGEGIFAQLYDADGQTVGNEFQVNTTSTNDQLTPVVAMDASGNFVVAWASNNQDGSGWGIYAQRYAADGTRLDGEFLVNTTTANNQTAPSIAMADNGKFVIAWVDSSLDGSGDGVYTRLFNADGSAATGELAVTVVTADHQRAPSVAMDADGDFVVAWQSKGQDGDGDGIFARRFDASGTALDVTDIAVNTLTVKHQTVPSVAMDADGNFVVAWQTEQHDGDGMGIFARRFDNTGAALDVADVQVNTATAKDQIAPSVSRNANGEFVIVWQSRDQDGDGEGIYGQWFDTSGTAVGGEVLLNLTTATDQTAPAVGIDASGDYVAVWASLDQDGDKNGIYATRLWRGDAYEFIVGDGTSDWLMQLTGTIEHLNRLMAGLTFTPTTGFNGTATLQVDIDDQGNTGTGGPMNDSATVYMVFNDAPVLDNTGDMSLNAIDEDVSDISNIGTLVSDIIDSAGGDRITDPNSPSFEGLAIIGVDDTYGTWQYSTDGGSTWLDFGAVAASSATLLTATANDRIRFVPNANYNGSVPAGITFRAWDTTDDRASGDTGVDVTVNGGYTPYSAAIETASIIVNAVNDLPTAANNTVVTLEDTAYIFVLGDFGFSDIDGDLLTQIQITSLESAGSLQLNGVDVVLNQVITAADITAGNLTFTPAADDNGTGYDSFDFRVHDGTAYSASSYTMAVDVTAVNDLPTAANNTVVTLEDTAYVFTVADFGFSDVDGDSLTQIQITSLEAVGSLQLNGIDVVLNQVITVADITAGNLTFTPAANDNGAGYDSFDFRVHDGSAYSTSSYTMTVDVTAVNDLPTAADNTITTNEDTAYVFTPADFGFSDIDGDSLAQIQITSLESVGSLQLNGVDVVLNQIITVADITAGNLTFTPAADDNGTGYDSFDFRVHDGTAYSASSYTMTVDVTAVNDLPTAANNTVVTLEDTAYVFVLGDFGFSDIDGDSLTQIQITSLEAVGSLQLNGIDVVLNQVISVADITAGNLTFAPAADDNGAGYDSFDFRVHDGTGYSTSSYTMTTDVTAVNDLPTAADNTVTTNEDTAYVFTVGDFGFSDIDGDSLTQIQITSLQSVGSLQLNGIDVVLNQVITVADITAGNLTFTPAADDNGAGYDSFDFRVHDGSAYSTSSYTMTVDVTAVNDLPTAADNTVTTNEDTAYVFTVVDFGFGDIDGDSLAQIQITSLESVGSLQLNGIDVVLNQVITIADITAGNLTFTPAADDNGTGYDSFDFRVHDGTAYSASSYTMTVDVTAVNDLPTAANNTVVTLEDTAYVFVLGDFGFSDIDGDSLTQIQISSLESAGSLQLNGIDVALNQVISVADITAGNLTFTPAADDNGAGYDSFDFRVHDGTGYSASSYTMTIDVTAVNDLPTAADNTITTNEDTAYVFTPADFGFSDIDGDSLAQIQITSLESVGSLQLNGVDVVLNQVITVADITAGNLTFTPAADDNGTGYDSFDFRVHDGTAYSAGSYTMTVDVTAVNDLPTAANNTVVTLEDTAYVFTVADFGFSDIDGDSLTQIEITSLESVGSLQLNGIDVVLNQVITVADITAGNLTFTPVADENGSGYDSFDFRVHDGTGYSASSYTMTIDVTAVNDLPTAANNTVVTLEDTAYVFVLGDFGFSDIDGDSLTQIQITSLEAVGSLQLNGIDVVLNQVITVADITAGNLTFTPAADDNGAGYDSFDFRVHDGTAYSAGSYTMTVDVTAVNDLPTAANNTVVTLEDTAYVFTVADFGFSDIDGDSLIQIQITSLEAVGSLQLNGIDVALNQVISVADITAGNLTFTPAADDNGAGYDSFDFRVHDGTAFSADSYTMTVDVTAVNDLPTAADNTVTTNEDTAYVFTVGDFGFSDIDGDSLTQIQITSLESVGSLQLNGVDVVLNQVITVADITAGNLTFTPAADDNGASYDTFDFRVHDGSAYSAMSYTITIDVTAVNDLPTAADNTVVAPEDTAYVFTVADFGFGDIDGNSLTQVQITSLASVGSLQLNGVDVVLNQVITVADITAGNLTFTPAADDNGAGYDSFDFRVHDGTAYSASSYTMTVDVTAVNDLPTAADNTVVTLEDTAYVFTVADFGFSDIDGDSLAQIQITSLESVGSLQLNGVDVVLNQVITVADITAGNLTFTPAADDNGASYDSFDFRVHDGTAYSAGSYTMTVDVTAVNDLPTAANNTVVTLEDTAYVFTVADFGFSDIDGDSLTQIQITSLEAVGSLQLNGIDVVLNQVISVADITAGNLTFTPAADDNGAGYDSFDFRVHDGSAYSTSSYTMTVDVTAVNDLPTAADNTVTTNEDTAYVFTVGDFGFSDIDGDSLAQIQITSLESVGSLQLNGIDVAVNQVITVADIAAGNLTFTPASDDNGTGYDSFDFRVHDGSAYSTSSYTMTVGVTAVNDPPSAANNTVVTLEDTAYVFTVADFGFSDIDGDSLTQIQIMSLESVGSLQLNGVDVVINQVITVADITAGNLTFTPAADDNGAGYDNFDFRVHDGAAYSASSYTMSINVTPVNDLPVGFDNTVSTLEDVDYIFGAVDFVFSDIDGDGLTQIQLMSLPTAGTLQLSGVDVVVNQVISIADIVAGNLTFSPAANGNGMAYDSFEFRVHDGAAYSSAGYTLSVDVVPVNDLPTAADNVVSILEDADYIFGTADFGFSDIDGDSLTAIRITGLPAAGTLQLFGVNVTLNQVISVSDIVDGNLVFAPAPGENGDGYDRFSFDVSDGFDTSATSYEIRIDVIGLDVEPLAVSDYLQTSEDTPFVIDNADLTGNDTVTTGSSISVTSVGEPQHGTLTLNDDGSYTYTPDADFFGTDSFVYTIADDLGRTAQAIVTIDLAPVNDAPVGALDAFQGAAETPLLIDVATLLSNDTDIDSDTLTITSVSNPSFGSLVNNGNGALTYIPLAGHTGSDSFTYIVSDDTGASDTVTVFVTITASNPVVDDPADDSEPDATSDTDSVPGQSADADSDDNEQTDEQEDSAPTTILAAPGVTELPGGLSMRLGLGETDSDRVNARTHAKPAAELLMRRDARIAVALQPVSVADSLDASVKLIRSVLAPVASNPVLIEALDALMHEVNDAMENEQDMQRLIVGTIKGGSSAALIAILYWVARGGALAAALFSSLPVWMRFDPVPILAAAKRKRKDEADEADETDLLASGGQSAPSSEAPR